VPPHERAPAGPFIATGGMAVSAFLYGYTAFALPSLVHSLLLPLVWLALFVLTSRWFTRRPVAVLALPVVAVAIWFGVLLLGPRN